MNKYADETKVKWDIERIRAEIDHRFAVAVLVNKKTR